MVDKPTTPPNWSDTLDADHLPLVQNRGWDKLDGNAAAIELAKAYRGSEKLRGGLASGDVVALPKPGADGQIDPAVAKAFWQKVGTPADATGYTFEGLKKKDGTALDAAYTDAARQAAAAVNMPAHMLKGFLETLQPHFDGQADAAQARQTLSVEENRRQLSHDWGVNEARNKFIATRAMDTLRDVFPNEAVAALESLPGVGYLGVMKMMLKLGEQMGEARFVPGSTGGTMTADTAQARWDQLRNDSAWIARWAAGGAAEIQEKADLMRIMHGARQ